MTKETKIVGHNLFEEDKEKAIFETGRGIGREEVLKQVEEIIEEQYEMLDYYERQVLRNITQKIQALNSPQEPLKLGSSLRIAEVDTNNQEGKTK